MGEDLLQVKDLRTYFHTDNGMARAVDGVSFEIGVGETLGLVGESGCGKSVASLSIMRLIPDPPGRIEAGAVLFRGQDLLKLKEQEMREIRGNEISMVFQEPMTSLNPVLTCGSQISETIRLHQKLDKKAAREKAMEMLTRVGIPAPGQRIDEYPHQLSGGMRQRVMIAMALSCNPSLLIADEPTTALDVTIQAQILELLAELQEAFHMAMLMITHDLGVIAEVADRVAVMYAGKIVEYAGVEETFGDPWHPYTQALLRSIPKMTDEKIRLSAIEGTVPDAVRFPSGCRFHPRCPFADRQCQELEPALLFLDEGHRVACWKAKGYPDASETHR